ncbi:uncharacterized protein LOC117605908 [Osmia lignaria lignaria]|uniref:uncharacterized protein LOC117605908 n=1 Tax=Osmia lignaria lignaria TaxID=1437193 RepID=UPI00402B13ED
MMSCKKFCLQKDQLIDDSELCSLSLEIFLRAHYLLKNFVDFFKFHGCICDDINYDKIPLHGALDTMATAMTSIICGKISNDKSESYGLFRDTCACVHCRNDEDVPDDIVQKVETILRCLQKSCAIENIIYRVKKVLHTLENSSACLMPERLQNLSLCLKEIMKKVICQPSKETVYNNQMKLTLNLVNKFIRDWSGKRSKTRPFLRICRYCNSVISETTRQWGTFCCKDAQRFHNIWKEWSLQQSISDASKSGEESKRKRLDGKQFLECSKDTSMMYVAGQERSRTFSPIEEFQAGLTMKYQASEGDKIARGIDGASWEQGTFHPAVKHPSTRETTRCTEAEVCSRKTESERYRVGGATSAKSTLQEREARRRCNIDRVDDEYPITSDGRRKRDDGPCRSKSEKIRALSCGLRDTTVERAAVGKMRKIRSGRKAKSNLSEMEPGGSGVERSKRAGKNDKSDRSRSRKGRRTKSDDDDDENEESTYDDRSDKKSKKMKGRKLYRNTPDEIEREKRVGKTYEGDREESTTGRRRRKKPRKGDMELDDATDTSKSTERKTDRSKREKKGVFYSLDEKGKTFKRGRKHRDSRDREQTGSDLKKKRKVRVGSASTEDKSTLSSESESKKGTSASSKKGRKGAHSHGIDDDYSKKSGSHDRKRKPGVTKDFVTGHRHPIEYQLSNQHFAKLGWTMIPIAKTLKKVVQYRTKPAKPHLDWFKKQRYNGQTYYDDGTTVFLNFRQDGSGEVYYPNGKLAIGVYKPSNCQYDMCTVFSPGGKDLMGIERKSQIVALFDSMGNGAIFDEDGATSLSYNQIGGIWRDNPAGLPFTWMWDTDQKKSIIKTVYMEKSAERLEKLLPSTTKVSQKSSGSTKASVTPASSRNKEKKVVEQKPVVVKHQKEEEEKAVATGDNSLAKYSKDPCHFKTIRIKLNDFICCRILNRSNINLQFSAGKKNIRIELGTVLDLDKEVASYFVDSSSKAAMLKGRFEKLLSSQVQPDGSLYYIAKGLEDVRKTARQRKFMMAKYRPFWYIWKKMGTRCRPR